MKINRLETHDRLIHFKKDQSASITQGCEDCLKKNPLSLALQARSPYVYIFAHPRTADDGFTKKMLWQPRLSKPKAQTNSYLFRAQSNTDNLEICWILPPSETWEQFNKGNVTESDHVRWSIHQFMNHRDMLETPFQDDFNEQEIRMILKDIAREMDQEIQMKKIHQKPKLMIEEGF